MPKDENNATPHYEMLYIVTNKYTEDELKPIVEEINKEIANCQGKITSFAEWGKKRLAYPIKQFTNGYYFLAEFDMPAENLQKLDEVCRMSNKILRHMITAKVLKSPEQLEREKRQKEIRQERQKKEIEQSIEKEKEKEKEKEAAKPDDKDKKKVDLRDLDQKLDELLDTDDLL